MANAAVTSWSPFPYYGFDAVRIWVRRSAFGLYQRHEWRRPDGSTRRDDWIPSPGRDLPAKAEPVDLPTVDDLLAALEQIAAGDNDARATAAATLQRWREA